MAQHPKSPYSSSHVCDDFLPYSAKLANTLTRRAQAAELPVYFLAATELPSIVTSLLLKADRELATRERERLELFARSCSGAIIQIGCSPWRLAARVVLPPDVEAVLEQLERRELPVTEELVRVESFERFATVARDSADRRRRASSLRPTG